jgi:hypothetical protein
MVRKMAKPEEVYKIKQVLITTDEQGNAIRVNIENTENICLFEIMKELMVNLTKLNWENTRYIFDERMEKIVFFFIRWTILNFLLKI